MIDKQIIDFNESLIGLRDFVEVIDPFLNEKIQEHDKRVKPLVVSAMLDKIISTKENWEEGEKEKFLEMQLTAKSEIDSIFNEETEVIFEPIKKDTKENDTKDDTGFSIKIKSNSNIVGQHMKNVENANKHIELLYTNSLISTLSTVEWFFSQLLHFYYDKYPESAGVHKRTLTLADLKTFNSISDAEKYLIDVKIDEILRGNFESWVTLLKTELGLNLGYLNDVIDELVEIYQRRNLFVHNGGVVNSIYLSKVKQDKRENILLNEKLKVDKLYLENSICKLQKSFILIGAELWKKLNPEDISRGEIIGEIVYENLLNSRWDICEGLCYFLINDARINPVDKVISQINYWLCKKELGQYASIKKEIDNIDFSDKKEIFQLGLYALRGETQKIIEILPIVLESNQTNIERLEEFPILREFRKTDEYKIFKSESKFFKEENKEVQKLSSTEK